MHNAAFRPVTTLYIKQSGQVFAGAVTWVYISRERVYGGRVVGVRSIASGHDIGDNYAALFRPAVRVY